jgi:hypothetical protein
VDRTSIPTAAGVVPPKIEVVDPEKLVAQSVTQAAPTPSVTKVETVPKKTKFFSRTMEVLRSGYFKAAAAATAFATATLIPRIGNASVIERLVDLARQEANNLSWRGVLAVSGLVLLTWLLSRLYFNRQNKARPGDKTPERILTKIVLPLVGAGLMAGAAIYGASLIVPFIAAPLAVSSSAVYLYLLGGAAGLALLQALWRTGKEIKKRIPSVFLPSNVVRGTVKSYRLFGRFGGPRINHPYSFLNRVFTTFLSFGAQLADTVYMSYRAVTLASVIGTLGIKMAFGFMNPAALVGDILLGTGIGVGYYLFFHRKTAGLINPNQHPSKPTRGFMSLLRLGAVGAVAGGMLSAIGPLYAVNMLFALAFFAAEAFHMLHAWRWNTAARAVEETPPKIYSDQDVANAALKPDTPFVTMLKTGFPGNVQEIIPALWTNILTRQGTNWEVVQTNGMDAFSTNESIGRPKAGAMYNGLNLLMQWNAVFREWLRATDARIDAEALAGNTAAAIDALADYYRDFADFCTTPNADNLGVPGYSGNLYAMGFGVNAIGFGGFDNEPTFHGTPDDTEHNRALGRRIYTLGGVFYRKAAADLRRLALEYQPGSPQHYSDAPNVRKASHQEVIAHLKQAVDQLYRKHNVPIEMFPSYMFTNRRLQISIAKIGTMNIYQGRVRDNLTGMSLVRFDPSNERFYLELIPTKVARVLKTEHDEDVWKENPDDPDYRRARNADSRPGEDNRFAWADRPLHTIGETHSDILYIDNSDHFMAHGHDLSVYPTAFNQEVPTLGPDEYFDVVFKDGFRLRVFGDGTVMHPGSQRMAPTDANTRGVRWLAGTPEPADAQLRCNARRARLRNEPAIQDFDVTWVKEAPFRPKYYFFNRTPYQSLSDSEQVDLIVTDFLAHFKEDQETPYIFLQWRIREDRKFDYDRTILDSPHDKVLMVSPATGFFLLRVKERGTGRILYIPYGLQKDWFPAVNRFRYTRTNPNTGAVENRPDRVNENVGMPEWKEIDMREGAALVTPTTDPDCPFAKALRVKIKYTERENRDGQLITTEQEYYRYLWYPRYLGEPESYLGHQAAINVHQEKVGPAPFIKFIVARKVKIKQGGKEIEVVTKRNGTPLSEEEQRIWETVVSFRPLSEKEYIKARPDIQSRVPLIHNNGNVSLPAGVTVKGKNVLDWFEYNELRNYLIEETLYERFLPAPTFMHYYDPTEIV